MGRCICIPQGWPLEEAGEALPRVPKYHECMSVAQTVETRPFLSPTISSAAFSLATDGAGWDCGTVCAQTEYSRWTFLVLVLLKRYDDAVVKILNENVAFK